jgi:hypothetical protein
VAIGPAKVEGTSGVNDHHPFSSVMHYGIKAMLKWGGILLAILVVADELSGADIFAKLLFVFVFHLLVGGLHYGWVTLPHMLPASMVVLGGTLVLVAACLALYAALCRRCPGLKQAISTLALILTLAAGAWSGLSLAGHAFRLVWKDPLVSPGRGYLYQAKRNGGEMIEALRRYAAGHGGNYPRHLGELVTLGVLTPARLNDLNRVSPAGDVPVPWIYLPGGTETQNGSTPVFVTPVARGRFLVVSWDSSVRTLENAEVSALLQKWGEERKLQRPLDQVRE